MIFHLQIETTLKALIEQEDTDGDKKITIEDKGPKAFEIVATSGNKYLVKGTYHLSNLLQELVIAKKEGKTVAEIPLSKIEEKPADRISRMIKNYFWNGLTRTMDEHGIKNLINDSKNKSLISDKLRIYIPYKDTTAYTYYKNLENSFPIQAIKLPEVVSSNFVKSINSKPGILSLKLKKEKEIIEGVPFVVPGGRFNEMYGWDSYFQSIGLILDGRIDLAIAAADHFQYEIEHYGKILNANRSYYLTRTQPPFYTSLIAEVFEITKDINWLKSHLKTAIKEYETVWMVKGKRLTKNGLNRYLAEGIGFPPECEDGHFDAIIKPLANAKQMSVNDYLIQYQEGVIKNEQLDIYFINDRSVRESGHDTSYRIDGNCSDLNLVDLNTMLYKYETDFAHLTETYFNGSFNGYNSAYWFTVASERSERMNKLMWCEEENQYFDYNFKTKEQTTFESATNFTPLWAGLVNHKKVSSLVKSLMFSLKEKGGIAACSEISRGEISTTRPARQWDYPNGWAPHQIMIWKGLLNYGFNDEAQELIYRWLYMITINAVNYNGTIPEKYDVVKGTHKVFAEYGNVGTDFEYITQEGFGWMNASFQFGFSKLSIINKQHLNNLIIPDEIFTKTQNYES